MATIEQDASLALSIAKLLGVQLDEWQEWVLRAMLSAHRDRPPVQGPYGECGNVLVLPDNVLRCVCIRGHSGPHQTGGSQWFNGGGLL